MISCILLLQAVFSSGHMCPKRLIYDQWFLSHKWTSLLVLGIVLNYLYLLCMVYIYVLVFKV